MADLEARLERRFVSALWRRLRIEPWRVVKLHAVGRRGYPDRMVLLDSGVVLFLELKRPGGKLTRLQKHIHDELRRIGHNVEVIESADDGVNIVRRYRTTSRGGDG